MPFGIIVINIIFVIVLFELWPFNWTYY